MTGRPATARVVITGLGVVAPIGVGCDAFWQALAQGRHAIGRFERATAPELRACMVASLPRPWEEQILHFDAVDPCAQLAMTAAREAWQRAGLERSGVRPEAIAVVLGTSAAGLASRSRYESCPRSSRAARHEWLERSQGARQTAAVAAALGIRGPRLTISTACSSSTHALGHACDLLAARHADVVLAGGADVALDELAAGFLALGAMSSEPCVPFSARMGMSLGEGAGMVVLERLEDARARGAELLCELCGWGSSSDGFHATAPDPTGDGMTRAMRAALNAAGLDSHAIDYVNAHGTGTDANDAAEWRALQSLLGPRAACCPVSSTKSYFGHALGAAGVLEVAATVLALGRGLILPTLGLKRTRAHAPADPVAAREPRPHEWRHALKLSAAFGGANAALVLGRAVDADRPPVERPERELVLAGASVIGRDGQADLDALLAAAEPVCGPPAAEAQRRRGPADAALVPDETLRSALRGLDLRGTDRTARLLMASAALALADASLRIRGGLRQRAGLFVGAGRMAWDSADEFWDSLRTRGFGRASAPAFSRLVLNAPAGAASRLLSLRGATSVVADGLGSSLRALALGRERLLGGDDVDLLVVGGAFELGAGMREELAFRATLGPVAPHGESAASVVLARAERCPDAQVRLAAVGLSGPDDPATSVTRCCEGAGLDPAAIDCVVVSAAGHAASELERRALAPLGPALPGARILLPAQWLGASEAMDAVALAAAYAALTCDRRRPRPGVALVLAASEEVGTVAALLERRTAANDGP